VDAKGVTYICEACPAGTSQSSGASLQCDACGFGEFQNECPGGDAASDGDWKSMPLVPAEENGTKKKHEPK